MRLSRLLAVQSCRWGKEKMTNTHWFVRHRWNWGIREVRGGKGSILTLMENYVCLPDIHEVYSYFSFVFLTIHPNDSRNRRGLQLPGIFPAVVNRIQNKSVGCSTLYLKYHHNLYSGKPSSPVVKSNNLEASSYPIPLISLMELRGFFLCLLFLKAVLRWAVSCNSAEPIFPFYQRLLSHKEWPYRSIVWEAYYNQ